MKFPRPFREGVLDIRSQEIERVLVMSVYLLLVVACYTTTKAVRDSLFVTKIGPSQLPYMYLLIAGVMGLISLFYSRAVHRIGLYRLMRLTSFVAISNLVLFWLVFRRSSTFWFYVLYVWVSLFGAIAVSQIWLLATHVFDAREARRVFAWIGAGGILGGILGGALTNQLAGRLGTESLLIACALMMALTLALLERAIRFTDPESVEDTKSRETEEPGVTQSALLKVVRESPHLTMMVCMLGAAVIAEAFIDYEYKSVAREFLTSKDRLTTFFGTITFWIGIVSLLFQMLITNRILKRFGVGWVILMLPSALLGAFGLMAVRPVLWSAALLQLVDGTFSYTTHRAGMELLYLPVPPQTRNTVKAFIDAFVDRFGRAIGGVLLVVLTALLSLSIPALSIIACVVVAAWIAVSVAVKREYVQSFRQALQKESIEPEALELRTLDRSSMRTLLGALSSGDEREVLYAVDLLSNTPPKAWRRQIDALIRHPSSAVRTRAIAVLARWNDPSITRPELIHHPDYQTARVAMVSVLGLLWTGSPRECALLERLLQDPDPAVVRQAIHTSGLVRYDRAIPVLIESLARRPLRAEARDALLKFGRRGANALVVALGVRSGNAQLRWHAMKTLNSMLVRMPRLSIDAQRVRLYIENHHKAHERLRTIRAWIQENGDADPKMQLLMRALDERIEETLDWVVRLTAVLYAPHDLYLMYHHWRDKPPLWPSAIEFMDNLLDNDVKGTVVPMLEESWDPEKFQSVERPNALRTWDSVREALTASDDTWLNAIAAEVNSASASEAA